MKRSLFVTLLVLVLLIAGVAVSVQAAEVPAGAEVIEIGTEAAWKEWLDGGSASKLMTYISGGDKTVHIKITDDFTITGATKAAYLSYGSEAGDVYLDLNGHTLTYKDTTVRWFGVYNPNTTVKIFNGKLINEAAAAGANGAFCIMTKGNLILEDIVYRDNTTHTYTQNSKLVRIPAAASLTMDNVDIQINTQNNTKGGVISAAGKLNINNSTISVSETGKAVQGGMISLDGGTTTINNSTLYGGMAQNGGMIYMTGKTTQLIVNSGTIAGGTATGNGGNIYMDGGANLQIKGGVLKDGTAANGGNIYAAVIGTDTGDAYQTDIEMTGGTVTGGLAIDAGETSGGGNIALFGNADNKTQPKLTVSGGTIGGAMLTPGREVGKASCGGNIYAVYGCLDVGGEAVISGGQASYLGGNIGYARGTFNVTGGTISGGVCNEMGGNIGLSGTATKVNISGGEILDGYAPKGGNIYIAARSMPVNITGGLIANGRCLTNGGNICAGNGKLTITGGTITGGQGGNGGNIYVQSTGSSCLTTIGNCTISNGTARNYGDDIYVSASGKLKVKKDFAGTVYMFVAQEHLPQTEGGSLSSANIACEGPLAGKVYLQNIPGVPALYGLTGDKKLYISTAAIAKKDGSVEWFKDNIEMVAAYGADADHLIPASGEVALSSGNYTADLLGKQVVFTGSGKVTCFDSANADYKTYGSATFEGVTLANEGAQKIDDVLYCPVTEENGAVSFHRLDMKITAISLRTSTAGVYYWADWDCDDTLAQQVESYGIACRLKDMPTANNLTEEKDTQRSVLYAAVAGTDVFAQQKENDEIAGAIMNNILSTENRTDDNGNMLSNDTCGKKLIYAAPYVTFKDGSALVAEEDMYYSLYHLVQQISQQKYTYAVYTKQLEKFFAAWEPYGINWALDFDVSEDIIHLESLYDGRTAYHGELHDHSNTGGTSDGKYTLEQWAEGMEKLGMDYAALLDHRQSLHMYLPAWDDSVFIGGTEAAGSITDRDERYNFFHYNMLFARPEQLESVLHAFPEYEFKEQTEGEHIGEWHFNYVSFTSARFNELITAVKEAGGFFAIPHPTGTEPQYTLENIADHYWFQDETGWEVFYGNDTDNSDYWFSRQNYAAWIELLKVGKRVWATSGNDDHEMPATTCLNTIYSTEGKAQAHIDQLRVGNFTAGPVGIKMCIGDTQMGGQCDFTGKRLVFSIGDIHESAWKEGYTYTVNLWKNEEVVSTWTIDGVEDFYYATDVDATAEYYRVEVYNKTLDRLIALGNPIWNLD